MRRSRGGRAAAALLLSYAVVAVCNAPTALAHEGEGAFEVESQGETIERASPYVVRLTWTNDGHPAIDATVTATAIAADGTPQTPVPLVAQGRDGRYSGTITFPAAGTWTVRFTSVTPAATLEVVQEVVESSTATSGSAPTSSASTPATDVAVDPTADGSGTPDDGGDGGVVGLLAAGFLAFLVIGGVIGVVRARRDRSSV